MYTVADLKLLGKLVEAYDKFGSTVGVITEVKEGVDLPYTVNGECWEYVELLTIEQAKKLITVE
jgi:hypothetical protein